MSFSYHLRMQFLLKFFTITGACLALVACVNHPQPSLQSLLWEAQGSLSVETGGHRQMMRFDWQQIAPDSFTLRLSTLTYAVIIQSRHGKITMNPSITNVAPQLWQDLYQVEFWLQGLPTPGIHPQPIIKRYDQSGHLVILIQQGWRIQYQDFQYDDGHSLPTRIMLVRPGIQVRLVIKDWYFSASQRKFSVPNATVILLRSV